MIVKKCDCCGSTEFKTQRYKKVLSQRLRIYISFDLFPRCIKEWVR